MAIDPIIGTPHHDHLLGTLTGDDLIDALGGNDNVDGLGGNDSIHGGNGADGLVGGSGNDLINGGAGNDFVFGGFDSDTLYGGAGDDVIGGNDGDDWAYGGAGNDTIEAGAHNSFFGGGEINHTFGGDGDDLIVVEFSAFGDIDGGDGTDTVQLEWNSVYGPDGPMTIALLNTRSYAVVVTPYASESLVMTSIERLDVATGFYGDFVSGGNLDDRITVSYGSDTVFGNGGNDQIGYYSNSAKHIDAGTGIDTITVGAWASGFMNVLTVTGNTGVDNFGSLIINAEKWNFVGGDEVDIATLGDMADRFSGGKDDDTVWGGGGNDHLIGGKGNDVLYGGDGDDVLRQAGGLDTVFGGFGSDTIVLKQTTDLRVLFGDFQAGQDHIQISAALLGGLVQAGALDVSQFSMDVAVGEVAQFVLRNDFPDNVKQLVFDSNGSADGGETLVMDTYFDNVLISDILIV